MKRYVQIVGPEFVPMHFEVASLPLRFAALFLDGLFVLIANVLVFFGAALLSGAIGVNDAWVPFVFVSSFGLVFFYHVFCEYIFTGRTLGKMILGLRVISIDGRELTADATNARNLIRHAGCWYPMVLLSIVTIVSMQSGWDLVGMLWIVVLVCFPLFTKNGQRAGDLVGGTIVIVNPRMVWQEEAGVAFRRLAKTYTFTTNHLSYYGEYELEVLAGIIRKAKGDSKVSIQVARTIANRIGYDVEEALLHPLAFLTAFYENQRKALEERLVFGTRKRWKRDSQSPPNDGI